MQSRASDAEFHSDQILREEIKRFLNATMAIPHSVISFGDPRTLILALPPSV
jgi:hypothetical protein